MNWGIIVISLLYIVAIIFFNIAWARFNGQFTNSNQKIMHIVNKIYVWFFVAIAVFTFCIEPNLFNIYCSGLAIIGTFALISGCFLWVKCNKALEEKQAREEQEKQEAETQRREKPFDIICSGITILDTCAWMDNRANDFFDLLRKKCIQKRHKILVPIAVYNEMINHCNGDDSDKRYKGRIAKRRMDDFSQAECLNLDPDVKERRNYADPIIIKLAEKLSREGCTCYVITNDIELRIRGQEYLRGVKEKEHLQNVARFILLNEFFQEEKWS